MTSDSDAGWLDAAAALAERARPLSRPNPAVGAILVRDGVVIGRGWTQPGGRPHAEAMALTQAGESARGATLYVTLEPCAHPSGRGPACADLLAASGIARAVIGTPDCDPRTRDKGLGRLRDAGIALRCAEDTACRRSLAGYFSAREAGRPHVTLKLATSLDGRIALPSGESRWITGPEARAHAHRERARADAILVGGETLRTDAPRLDIRLPGLAERAPARWVLTRGAAPESWTVIEAPERIGSHTHPGVQYLLIEGGGGAAAAFLRAGLIDRLLIYRAPILIGDGRPALGDIGLPSLADAHGRWRMVDRRAFGRDTLEIFE